MGVLCICETEWRMNQLALVTSLKVSGSFPKIAGNFPEFYSDGVVEGYIMLRSLLVTSVLVSYILM
jgi:hypothetical protein